VSLFLFNQNVNIAAFFSSFERNLSQTSHTV